MFAILITVLVLELRPPELPTFKALLLLWPTWLSYTVSYLFIAIVWTNHHYLMRYAAEASPRLLWFNFAHLFSLSLLPLSTAWMAVSELAPQPVAFYAAVFFLVNATYICLIWELIDRTPGLAEGAQDHALPIDHDLMPVRGGCSCSAEISTCWSRNMYLLPRRLSETTSTGSWEANISGIKRTICIPADLLYPSLRCGEMRKRIEVPDRSTVEYPDIARPAGVEREMRDYLRDLAGFDAVMERQVEMVGHLDRLVARDQGGKRNDAAVPWRDTRMGTLGGCPKSSPT